MKVSFYAFGIATLLFTAFGLAGFARFGDEVLGNVLKSYSPDDPMIQLSWGCMMVSTVFNFPHAFQRMRSSFNALLNKGPEDNFIFTTILLLSVSVYMGVAFKDIAVIKMIKGATLGVSIMFIFPALFFIYLNEPIRFKRKCSGDINDPMSQVRRRRRAKRLSVLCVIMMITGFVQGALALMVHYNII